jgi:hypothetical protein
VLERNECSFEERGGIRIIRGEGDDMRGFGFLVALEGGSWVGGNSSKVIIRVGPGM